MITQENLERASKSNYAFFIPEEMGTENVVIKGDRGYLFEILPEDSQRHIDRAYFTGYHKLYIAKELKTRKRVIIKKLPPPKDEEKAKQNIERQRNFKSAQRLRPLVDSIGTHIEIFPFYPHKLTELLLQIREQKISQKKRTQIRHHIAKEMILAVAELHQKFSFAHNDIKTSNFLIKANGIIAISDFTTLTGLEDKVSRIINSYSHRPPECFKSNSEEVVPEKTDAWALGISILSIFTHKNPLIIPSLENNQEMSQLIAYTRALGNEFNKNRRNTIQIKIHNLIKDKFIPNLIPQLTRTLKLLPNPDLKDLLILLLHPNPKKRLTPMEALLHPYTNTTQTNAINLRKLLS